MENEMSISMIPFQDWILIVDREITQSTFVSVASGGAEDCECSDCKNYVANRDAVFPDKIKSLFMHLGIDYRKESEVWKMYIDKDGLHCYNGIFHYKGRFEGKNASVPLIGGNAMIPMISTNNIFRIGFHMGSDLTYFVDKGNIVQVDFEGKLPWIIDKKLES